MCTIVIMLCRVCGCMQTQHKVELDARDKAGGGVAPLPMQVCGTVTGCSAVHASACF